MELRFDRRSALAGGGAALLAACEGAGAPISGTVLTPDSDRYEAWRTAMVWQARKPDRRPAMIVRPRDNADISAALRLARRRGLQVTTKSGGHHIWGAQLREGAVLIDLWERRGLEIEERSQTAWVEPSLWSRDFQERLLARGLAFPVGHCATLGMGGFLIGGGLGVNWTNWGGMSCYSVLAAEVITADGRLRIVDAEYEPDLFWAARGAGNGFPGVVTRFKVKLYPAPTDLRWSMYVFPLSQTDAAVALLKSLTALDLGNCELLSLFAHAPSAPLDARGRDAKVCAVRANIFGRDAADAQASVRRIAAAARASGAVFKLEDQRSTFEHSFVESMDFRRGFGLGRFGVDNVWTNDTQVALNVLATPFSEAPSWKSHVVISMRPSDLAAPDAACRMHGNTYLGVYASWDGAAQDDANLAWLRRCAAALRPVAVGHYVNEIDAESDPHIVERCFDAEAWRRLGVVRERYDPDRRFVGFFGR